ncbi:MAG TPA: HAMP domain-containing sensor histidine kinase [Blastocatellia bacterium]|nr:HAMP domain-containing sensor histidine kinase [Blastocatellia bacterium]
MNAQSEPAGVALLCSRQGDILQIVRDELGVAEGLEAGQPFASLLDAESRTKAEAFLAVLRFRQAAFNWQMNVSLNAEVISLHFAGGAIGDNFLIVGAKSRSGAARFYEEMVKINNEQTNALRQAARDLAEQARPRDDPDAGLYDELSRLNNELVTAQRELAKKNAELGRLNDQKNQLLGMAAHDLRNPLSAILTLSEFLLDQKLHVTGDEQEEFIRRIRSSSEFMLRLVNDLLDISKIEAGRLDLDLEATDLRAIIEDNVALNRILADKRQVRLSLVQDEDIPRLMLDPAKIEQVLNNLIVNAIKFSPSGGAVEVRLNKGENDVTISVSDQGPGIPEEEFHKLFNPFEKTSAKSASKEKGTGLGLAIVKKIVSGHQGKIRVESQVGKGSTFHVTLPLTLSRPSLAAR